MCDPTERSQGDAYRRLGELPPGEPHPFDKSIGRSCSMIRMGGVEAVWPNAAALAWPTNASPASTETAPDSPTGWPPVVARQSPRQHR
jgi:hypothetical protein